MITGHRGFIGSNLSACIKDIGIDLKEGVDIRTCDFPDTKVIWHLAAQASIPKSFEDPVESNSHNVVGTLRILEHARKTGAKVIFSSSSSIYDPVSPYAVQKLICEEYMKLYWSLGVKSVALRYFNVFGENQSIANGGDGLALAIFLKQYKEGKPFTVVGTGEQRRDFVYVGDVVRANIIAADYLETATEFKVFDVGNGYNYSINEVLDMIDPKHPRVHIPPRVEPFENKADINKRLPLWTPKTTLPQWLQLS